MKKLLLVFLVFGFVIGCVMVGDVTSIIDLFIILMFGVFISYYLKNNEYKCYFGKTGNKVRKDVLPFSDIPCNKNIFYAFWVAHNYNLTEKKEDFLGAVLLKWIHDGNVRFKRVAIDGKFNDKVCSNIYFVKRPMEIPEMEMEVRLYDYMYAASYDGKLEQNEFKRWCCSNYQKIFKWFDDCLYKETLKLVDMGKITYQKGKRYNFYKCFEVDSSMMDVAEQMAGLKKFLKEFSVIDKREPLEVGLWNEYLMYAQIFGLADDIDNKFIKLYPEVINDMDSIGYDFSDIVFIRSITNNGIR